MEVEPQPPLGDQDGRGRGRDRDHPGGRRDGHDLARARDGRRRGPARTARPGRHQARQRRRGRAGRGPDLRHPVPQHGQHADPRRLDRSTASCPASTTSPAAPRARRGPSSPPPRTASARPSCAGTSPAPSSQVPKGTSRSRRSSAELSGGTLPEQGLTPLPVGWPGQSACPPPRSSPPQPSRRCLGGPQIPLVNPLRPLRLRETPCTCIRKVYSDA